MLFYCVLFFGIKKLWRQDLWCNAFHIFVLKTYVHDATHVIEWNVVQVEPEGEVLVEPDCILGRTDTIQNVIQNIFIINK